MLFFIGSIKEGCDPIDFRNGKKLETPPSEHDETMFIEKNEVRGQDVVEEHDQVSLIKGD